MMREAIFFKIASTEVNTGDRNLFDVIGAVVTMPNSCGEQFVVHQNQRDTTGHEFKVSHAESGLHIAGGDTIREAIQAASAVMTRHSPQVIAEAIARGMAQLVEVKKEIEARKKAGALKFTQHSNIQ